MRMSPFLLWMGCLAAEDSTWSATPEVPPPTEGCSSCYVDVSSREVYLLRKSPDLDQYTNLVFHGLDANNNHYTYDVPPLSDPPTETWFVIPGSGSLPLVQAGVTGTVNGDDQQFTVPVVP